MESVHGKGWITIRLKRTTLLIHYVSPRYLVVSTKSALFA